MSRSVPVQVPPVKVNLGPSIMVKRRANKEASTEDGKEQQVAPGGKPVLFIIFSRVISSYTSLHTAVSFVHVQIT